MLNDEIKQYIGRSVLCWLATCNRQGEPNVSPKEMFTYTDDHTLLIAHIASPNSVKNIRENPRVCVSMVDIFVQKGFKLMGKARLIFPDEHEFAEKAHRFIARFGEGYPIRALIEITVQRTERIIAPNYILKPGTTEESQVREALRTYSVQLSNSGFPGFENSH